MANLGVDFNRWETDEYDPDGVTTTATTWSTGEVLYTVYDLVDSMRKEV